MVVTPRCINFFLMGPVGLGIGRSSSQNTVPEVSGLHPHRTGNDHATTHSLSGLRRQLR
jgi:hypothetical protein